MNTGQIKKYRCHVRDWKKAREVRGLPADDETRYALHKRITGRACSSTAFTQKEFDDVLGALLADSKPADFNAQMEQQEQEGRRTSLTLARIFWISHHVGANAGNESGYVRGIARNTFGTDQFLQLNFEQLKQLEGILKRQVERRHGAERAKEIFAEADAESKRPAPTPAPRREAMAYEPGEEPF